MERELFPELQYSIFEKENTEIEYFPDFLTREESKIFFQSLLGSVPWQSNEILIFGKKIREPRLTAWYGDPGKSYIYSGLFHEPNPWTQELFDMRKRIEGKTKKIFNSVLLNLYRDGNDSVDWHSDDEKELGKDPFIASLSLGVTRKFQIRHKFKPEYKKDLNLESGSLLIMGKNSQILWKHKIPKEKTCKEPRINLTFRTIL